MSFARWALHKYTYRKKVLEKYTQTNFLPELDHLNKRAKGPIKVELKVFWTNAQFTKSLPPCKIILIISVAPFGAKPIAFLLTWHNFSVSHKTVAIRCQSNRESIKDGHRYAAETFLCLLLRAVASPYKATGHNHISRPENFLCSSVESLLSFFGWSSMQISANVKKNAQHYSTEF